MSLKSRRVQWVKHWHWTGYILVRPTLIVLVILWHKISQIDASVMSDQFQLLQLGYGAQGMDI